MSKESNENLPRSTDMESSLRDRILEEVLDGILSMFSENDSVEMAAGYITDAVIRELKLEVEDGECGYCQAQLPGCRYSTWVGDE